MKNNKKNAGIKANNHQNTSCNSCEVNVEMDNSLYEDGGNVFEADLDMGLTRIANLEAGVDNSLYEVDGDLDKTLARVANIEAGTDIMVSGNALAQEAAVNSGLGGIGAVTDDVMYHNLAKYTMIDIDDENIQNNQGS